MVTFYTPARGSETAVMGEFESAKMRSRVELATDRSFDLYALDSLDVAAMQNVGLLADLYPYMTADENFHESEYYMHIWRLFEQKGCLYEFVPVFGIGGVIGPEHVMGNRKGWTMEEFWALYEGYDGDGSFINITRDTILSYMIQYGISDYVDMETNTCDFMNESFYQWLEFIGRFSNKRVIAAAPLWISRIHGVNNYDQLARQWDDTLIIAGVPQEGAEGPCAEALKSFGISATTDKAEQCWEFMRFLMSDEAQAILDRDFGFPMRRDIVERQLEGLTLPSDDPDSYYYGRSNIDGTPMPGLAEETVDYLRQLLKTVDQLRFRNDQINEIVTEEATIYFEEVENPYPVEEIARRIQERVAILLQEREAIGES